MRQAHALIFAFCCTELSAFPCRLTRNICQLIFIDTVQVARSFRRFRCLLCLQFVERGVFLFAFVFPLKFLSSKRNPTTLLIKLPWIFQRFIVNLMVQHIVPLLDTILTAIQNVLPIHVCINVVSSSSSSLGPVANATDVLQP